ncbi:MAG: DUF6153 family protein [Nocardioides sp.]|uniref:DUF6153 family protein n=1 Tax=Nocardioides sp. TaxID=35761 RepID=UPI00238D9ADE|nr:DUF6153 family protein [Nocardioides sp.]MDE0776381.1 DUF6153 family protein [Nocardioides sp.]
MRTKPRRRALRTWSVAILVGFAVSAMHVLSSPIAVAGPDHGSHVVAEWVAGHAAAAAEQESPTSPGDGRDAHGSHGGLAGMCLALLGALVLAMVVPGGGRGWLPTRLADLAQRLARSHGRFGGLAPPDLHVLCIARC